MTIMEMHLQAMYETKVNQFFYLHFSKQRGFEKIKEETHNYQYVRRLRNKLCVERHRLRSFTGNNLPENKITKYYAASGLYVSRGLCLLSPLL